MTKPDSVLTCGYYKCFDKKFSEHTYAKVEQGSTTVWFDCYGGHAGKGNVYPAKLWKPKFRRFSSKTGKRSVRVNLALARGVSCGDPNDKRTVYNEKTGGPFYYNWKLGDNSGLIYAFMGVCHNMCNRIMLAAGSGTSSLINRPPSFEASYYLYGYWGGGTDPATTVPPAPFGTGSFADGVSGLSAMNRVRYIKSKMAAKGASELQAIDAAMAETQQAELSNYAATAYTPESRRAVLQQAVIPYLLEGLAPGEAPSLTLDELVALDEAPQRVKQDIDNQLLQGKIKQSDYADALNTAVNDYFKRLCERMGESAFEETFGLDPYDEDMGTVIHPELMPDLAQYREIGYAIRKG